MEAMDVVGGLLQALFMVLGFALWVLPIAIAVWILLKISVMSRDMTLLKRQLAVIAEHSGAPIVPQPPQSRGARAPLWAFAIVLVVFLVVMVGLYAAPGMLWRMEATELERVGESGGSSGSFSGPEGAPEPAEAPPAMPEPVPRTPGG